MLLRELADRETKVTITRNDDRVLNVKANIGGREIMFTAIFIDGRLFGPHWNVVFSEEVFDENDGSWNSSVDVTGSGAEFEVLSMITTAMKLLLKKNPNVVRFTAKTSDNRARANIYRRLATKIFKGYERSEETLGDEIEFTFEKPKREIEV